MSKPRRIVVWALGVTALLLGAARATDTPPDVLVKMTVEDVLALIEQNPNEQQLLKLAENRVLPHFDFERMTQLAMGRAWPSATPSQRDLLEREFRILLVRTYTRAIAGGAHKGLKLEIKPLRAPPEDTNVTVKTRVHEAGAPPIAIDYRMAKTPAGWKVYDVAVENVSLVTTHRSSFATEIKRSGIEGLINALVKKNQTLATP